MGTGDEEKSPPEPPPVIFIHRIDTYFGKVLAQQLGTNQPNATTSDVPDSGANFKGLTFLDAPGAPDCFQIIGSYRLPKIPDDSLIPKLDRSPPPPKVPAARELFSVDSEEELLKALDRAKIHIYHTADEDGENELFSDVEKALTAAKAHLLANKNKKTVFLVSPLMTWCKTRVKVPKLKPKDGEKEEEEEQVEDEPQPLTEEEAKRRKPHTKFKAHLDMEKDLLKFAKNSHRRISATVVGAGLTYGYGERILRWYFKDAWHNAPVLTVLGDGKNQVPMIHVRDLAQVLQNMCDSKPKTRYIIAIDAGIHTYQELVTGIAKQLTGGTVINIPPETLVVEKKVSQIDSELLTADLLFEARTILETMKIQWTAEEGFLKALPKVIREYKTLQNLTPIKVAIIGPPFSGKTTMAMKLADYYKLHYVSAENIVKDTEVKLAVKLRPVVASPAITVVKVPTTEISETEDDEKPAKSVKIPANESEDANDDGDQIGIQAAKKLLAEMQDSRNENNGHLGEAMIVRLLREKLLSKACLNQGYVLDGAPASYNMAKELFAPVELEEEEEKEEESRENEEDIDNEMPPTDKKLVPDYIFYLDIPLEITLKKKMDDPAGLCGMTEKQFKQRLLKYAKQNPEDQQNTLVFFDEIENHAQWLDVSSRGYDEPAQLITFLAMLHKIGRPHNYGLTDEEKKASAIRDEITRLERSAKQEECRQKQEEANRPEQIIKEAAWKKQLELLQMEEYAKRELMAMPVQQYLYKYVFPTVHDGLLQCGRLLPSDPVDFLAEYLLQKSKPSNWSESNRLFEVRKRLEAKPAAEREATIIADAIAAAGAGDAPAPVVEEKQFFIAETAHMFADLSERLSLADVELASEAAYMTLDLSESTLNAALAKAGSVPKEIELANKAITNV